MNPQNAQNHAPNHAAELAEIRAEIARLQARETSLCRQEADAPLPRSRPGWPIRRCGGSPAPVQHMP